MTAVATVESFKRDTAKFKLTILHDDGVYRHLRIGDPETFCQAFQITTWPGHLEYSGDMGDYVFSRLDDMFRFFRGDSINPSYWAEKLQAIDRADGVKKYSPTLARDYINEQLEGHEASDEVRKKPSRSMWITVKTSSAGSSEISPRMKPSSPTPGKPTLRTTPTDLSGAATR